MLKTRVIPILTVKAERLVKSVRFEHHRNIGSYISAVRVFNVRDVDELIFLDLDAREKGIQPWLLSEVTKECFMPVTLGGGVKSIEDVQTLLAVGADKVAINSAALMDPSLITRAADRYGRQCVVVSIDVRKKGSGYEVYADGGMRTTGKDARTWAQEAEAAGAGEILITAIENDGEMEGYDLELIKTISDTVRIPVIASGGAGVPAHAVAAAQAGASAVAAASMFQYTHVTPHDVKKALHDAGIPARL